jgi:hypothetical protein
LILDLYGQCSLILPGENTGLSSSFKIFDEKIEKGNPGVNLDCLCGDEKDLIY